MPTKLKKLKEAARAAILWEARARLYAPSPEAAKQMYAAKEKLDRLINRLATGKGDFWSAAKRILGPVPSRKMKRGKQGKGSRTKTKS